MDLNNLIIAIVLEGCFQWMRQDRRIKLGRVEFINAGKKVVLEMNHRRERLAS